MANFFGGANILPVEYVHTNKQHPYTIKVINKWIVQSGMRTDLSSVSSEKSFRKYFGKKVKELICISKSPSFPGYRCKFLKTAKIYAQYSWRYALRNIENLHVADSSSWIRSRYRNNPNLKGRPGFGRLSNLKRLKSIEAESGRLDISLKPFKALTQLHTLSLTMEEDAFAKNYHNLMDIKSLKTLRLSIISVKIGNPWMNQIERPALADFLTEATSKKKLDFLGMKLTDIFDMIGPKSRSRFLECLGTTDIPAFDIELIATDSSRIDPESVRFCIKNIDLLELDFDKDASVSVACRNDNIDCQSIAKPRKKLKMLLKFQLGRLNANPMLAQSEDNSLRPEISFHSLDLASKLENLFRDCFGSPFSLSVASNIRHLKSFSFNFSRILEIMSERIDSVFLATLENESHLEHLQLQRDTGPCSIKSDVYHYFSMLYRTPAIQNLTSLHLTDFSVRESLFTILSQIFHHLRNLRTLRLDFQKFELNDGPDQSQAVLSIPENSKLADVYTRLPQLNGSMISDLIKTIMNMHELEELSLLSGNQLIEKDKNRIVLLDGFKRLKKLRKVSLFRAIQDSSFASGVRNDHKNPVVLKVQNELKELFDFNWSMCKFCIESNDPPYQIRYKRS